MGVFSSVELAEFKETQDSSFQSICSISRNTVSTDSYGDTVLSPTVTTSIPCGLSLTGGNYTEKESNITIDFDAVLRLPVGIATIGLNDTITITSHLGNTKNDTFKLVSVPEIGTVLSVKLKRWNN